MTDPLRSAVEQLRHDVGSVEAYLARALCSTYFAEQLCYVAKRLGDLQVEARNLEQEARRR